MDRQTGIDGMSCLEVVEELAEVLVERPGVSWVIVRSTSARSHLQDV